MNEKEKETLIYYMDQSLYDMEFGDIRKCQAQLSCFILACCFIDALAGFYAGIDTNTMTSGAGDRFKNFVKEYLPKEYKSDKLWRDLRCGLVHSYASTPDSYVFVDHKSTLHFKKTKNGQSILNLENFLLDIEKAYMRFKEDILTNEELFQKAKHRFETLGLMSTGKQEIA